MNLSGETFKLRDHDKDCYKITLSGELTGNDAAVLREAIEAYSISEYEVIYVDTRDVTVLDLSSVNEIIHTHYTLDQAAKKLVFLYQQGSAVEQWVETTGLDKFVTTAMVPADS